MYLVFEYCEKSVFSLIKETEEIDEVKIREVIKDILLGLQELHRNGFIHRDLKPENILIQNHCSKLADFGLAKEMRTGCVCTEYVSTR